MPLLDGEEPVSLGEGFTPLIHASRLGARLNLSRLYVKDESLNPTNSFKARGLSAAITRARSLGAHTVSVPSAGNAGCATAAYAARAGMAAHVFLPRDAKVAFARECLSYGASVTLVDGLITDAGRIAAEQGAARGWYDVSTLKEPYRIEGKKTMGYELAEQLDWRLPDWILYPTGGGTGLIGMWKAFDEMERLGWIGRRPPANGLGSGFRLRAHRARVRERRRAGAGVGRSLDGGRWPACAASHRRLSDSPGHSRERRATPSRSTIETCWRPCVSWAEWKGSRPRRNRARPSSRCDVSSNPAASGPTIWWCSSIPAARSSISI